MLRGDGFPSNHVSAASCCIVCVIWESCNSYLCCCRDTYLKEEPGEYVLGMYR
jgi:hypothetical protein